MWLLLHCLDYKSAIHPLPVIKSDHGLHLRALVGIEKDEMGVKRRIGDEWQLRGPMTYIPQPEVVCVFVCWFVVWCVHVCVCVHSTRLKQT